MTVDLCIADTPREGDDQALVRASPILRTGAALLSVQGVTWLSTLIGILVVPRLLGPSSLGIFATAYTAAGIIAVVAGFGTANQVVKSVARNRGAAADLVAHVILIRVAIWAACSVVSFLVAAVVVVETDATIILLLILLGSGLGLVSDAFTAALQGDHALGKAAARSSAIGIGAQAATIAALALGGGLFALSTIGVVAAVIGVCVVFPLFRVRFQGSVSWSRQTTIGVLAGGVPFLAWELALQVYGAADYFILALLTDKATVGHYAFAYRLAGVPAFAATIATAAVYPTLAAAALEDRAWFRTVLTNGVRIILIATLPMATGLVILAPYLTRMVGGGNTFAASEPLLMILALHVPLAAVHTLIGISLFALDRQRTTAIVAWAAAALNPAANLVMIPLAASHWDNGAVGAAMVAVGTECFMGFWIWRAIGRNLGRRLVARVASGALLACVLMSVAMHLALPWTGPLAAIPLGAAVYCLSLLLIRVVSVGELSQVREALSRR